MKEAKATAKKSIFGRIVGNIFTTDARDTELIPRNNAKTAVNLEKTAEPSCFPVFLALSILELEELETTLGATGAFETEDAGLAGIGALTAAFLPFEV